MKCLVILKRLKVWEIEAWTGRKEKSKSYPKTLKRLNTTKRMWDIKCPYCPKMFDRTTNAEVHVDSKHSDVREDTHNQTTKAWVHPPRPPPKKKKKKFSGSYFFCTFIPSS